MMPSDIETLEAAFSRHGIGEGIRVVLYCVGNRAWSTRFWWMLRSLGFDAAVLDGGFDKWVAEGRETESGEPKGYPAATFKANPRTGMFVDKDAVINAIGNTDVVTINSLSPQLHSGLGATPYKRPGRVPNSANVWFLSLVDPQTKTFVKLADAAAKFEAQGVTKDRKVICYCAGGISATVDLFMLHQLGFENLALYDGSLNEWASDPTLPIETDND